jgi:hypothetical protein
MRDAARMRITAALAPRVRMRAGAHQYDAATKHELISASSYDNPPATQQQ